MTEPHEFTPTQNGSWMGRFSDVLSRIAVDAEAMRWQRLPAACTAIVLTLTGCAPVVAATPKPSVSVGTATPEMTPSPTPETTVPATTPGLPTPESPTAQPTPDETTKAPTSSPTAETPQKIVTYSKEAKKVLKLSRLDKIWELSSHTREVFANEVVQGYKDELSAAIDNDEKIPQHIRDTWSDFFEDDTINLSGAENSNEILDFLMAERLIAFKLVDIAGLNIANRFRVAIDSHTGDFDSDIHPTNFGEPKLAWDLVQMKKGAKYPSWLVSVNSSDYEGSDTTFDCKRMTFAMGEADRPDFIPGLWVSFKVKNPDKKANGKPYKPFWLIAVMIDPSDIDKRPASVWYQWQISDVNPRLAHKPSDYPDSKGNTALVLEDAKGETVCTYP